MTININRQSTARQDGRGGMNGREERDSSIGAVCSRWEASNRGATPRRAGRAIICHQNNFIVDLNIYRSQTGFLEQDLVRMSIELLVILGAEASILVFVAAMNLHAKRMDVLRGRSFEHPIFSPRGNKHLARSSHRMGRDLLRLIGGWTISSRSFHPISCGAPITRMLQRILQTGTQTPSRRTGTPAPGSRDRPVLLSGADPTTDAQRKGASPESIRSSAAAILHQLSAP